MRLTVEKRWEKVWWLLFLILLKIVVSLMAFKKKPNKQKTSWGWSSSKKWVFQQLFSCRSLTLKMRIGFLWFAINTSWRRLFSMAWWRIFVIIRYKRCGRRDAPWKEVDLSEYLWSQLVQFSSQSIIIHPNGH